MLSPVMLAWVHVSSVQRTSLAYQWSTSRTPSVTLVRGGIPRATALAAIPHVTRRVAPELGVRSKRATAHVIAVSAPVRALARGPLAPQGHTRVTTTRVGDALVRVPTLCAVGKVAAMVAYLFARGTAFVRRPPRSDLATPPRATVRVGPAVASLVVCELIIT